MENCKCYGCTTMRHPCVNDNDRKSMIIDFNKVKVLNVDGIDMKDYPKFCDAYIAEALIDGVEASDEELDVINENYSFLEEAICNHIN